MTQLRVAIWLCNHLLGEAVKRLIADEFPGRPVFNCADCGEVAEVNPNLLMTDFKTLSLESFKPLHKLKIKILLIETACMDTVITEELYSLIGMGIAGILPCKCTIQQLKRAVNSVISGELWLNRRRLSDVITRIRFDQLDPRPVLTKSEKRIVQMICRGFRNKEIMETLNISEQAVKSHLSRIYKKIGVCDRLQLAIYAHKHWPNYLDET
ncbi:MAG: response regulator transcription factor [Desulfobacteraceae bacterium]|nr:response regulator transcription factor [Desulfobacteraceae bacterium]